MEQFEGKVAFITGGASGIGLGIAKVFAKHKMKVVIVDMRQYALDEAMAWFSENGGDVYPINLDVTDREAYVSAADEAEKVYGKIHVLVNNAGIGCGGPIDKINYKDWEYGINVNLWGVINGVMTILPRIIKHGEGGHIVSTSSTCGLMGTDNMSIYCTTKYAVCGLMESIAGELKPKNIGVSILIPGLTMTDLGRSTFENRPEHLRNEGEVWPPPPPKDGEQRKRPPVQDIAMDPLESGERVLRGIRNNDLYIMTHPEWKAGYAARHDAIIRACPDEPLHPRWDAYMNFGKVIYNDIYDQQKQVGPPDWE